MRVKELQPLKAPRVLDHLTQFRNRELVRAPGSAHRRPIPPMAYLIERKSQTIFVTGTSIIAKGKPREMTVESRPEYAVVQLSGLREALPVPWEEVYQAAMRRHKANLRLEREATRKAHHSEHSNGKAR